MSVRLPFAVEFAAKLFSGHTASSAVMVGAFCGWLWSAQAWMWGENMIYMPHRVATLFQGLRVQSRSPTFSTTSVDGVINQIGWSSKGNVSVMTMLAEMRSDLTVAINQRDSSSREAAARYDAAMSKLDRLIELFQQARLEDADNHDEAIRDLRSELIAFRRDVLSYRQRRALQERQQLGGDSREDERAEEVGDE